MDKVEQIIGKGYNVKINPCFSHSDSKLTGYFITISGYWGFDAVPEKTFPKHEKLDDALDAVLAFVKE